jgi:hypothetical protein
MQGRGAKGLVVGAAAAVLLAATAWFVRRDGPAATPTVDSAASGAASATLGAGETHGETAAEAATTDSNAQRRAAEMAIEVAGVAGAAASETWFDVLVKWPDGGPVEGARIEVEGAAHEHASDVDATDENGASEGEDGSKNDREVEPILTDAQGRARVSIEGDSVLVRATRDEHESLPRSVQGGEIVHLTLLPTVSAEGALKVHARLDDADMLVTCFAIDGARRVQLAQRKTSIDRPWRMERLPMPDFGRYVFRFESDVTVTLEPTRTATQPGEVLRVDIGLEPGYVRQILVLDTAGKPIEAARVTAVYTNSFNRDVSIYGITDAEGRCAMSGIPAREGHLFARKPGYEVTQYPPLIHGLLPGDEAWTITMAKAAPVRGRVVANGAGVRDFELLWHPHGMRFPEKREFRDAEDGAFELLEIAPGEVWLVAVSDTHGQTVAQPVTVTAEGAEGVQLEFSGHVTLRGQVVDETTEVGIANAQVQLVSSTPSSILGARGAPLRTDGEGRFSSNEFNVGINRFEVSAAGYATKLQGVFAAAGEVTDAGIVRLSRTQPLALELLHGPDIVPTESYATGAQGGRLLAPVVFDAQGQTKFESVSPGPWRIRVKLSDGLDLYNDLALRPGEDWRLRVDLRSLDPWNVEVREADGAGVDPGCDARLIWREDGVTRNIGGASDFGNAAPLRAPRGGRGVLCVVRLDGSIAYVANVGPEEFKQDPYVVKLGDARHGFRVVDSTAKPMAGATVQLCAPGFAMSNAFTAVTGADGLASLAAPKTTPDVIVSHAHVGMAAFLGLGASDERAGVYELELNPEGPAEIVVRDGSFVVAGAELDLIAGEYVVSRPRTGADGIAKTIPLNAGKWRARFESPGYWPGQADFEVKSGLRPVPLQVRRLADAEFEVRSATGAGVAGLAVELESVEFGESASEWLARGRIEASASTLALDSEGKLRVSGLPHGKYRWSVAAGAEPLATGEVTLPPRALTRIEATVR